MKKARTFVIFMIFVFMCIYLQEENTNYAFAGQLKELKYSLSNPLEQYTGIVFIGDSITWGRTLPNNAIFEPRDGTLSDPRDNFTSDSYVNKFKRYIGNTYAPNELPNKSNYSYSDSGESITTYTKKYVLFPFGGNFKYSATGTVPRSNLITYSKSISGYQLQTIIDSSKEETASISFQFTGDSFTLSYSVEESSMDYELIVDGINQGIFSTAPGIDGNVIGQSNERTHKFSYVRNKNIEIKTIKNKYNGYQSLKINGLIINKTIRISNQGINGATTDSYLKRNLIGNKMGDGVAFDIYDNYVFIQLGTNDRIIRKGIPKGVDEFDKNLESLINSIKPFSNIILMVSNPAKNEDKNKYSFTMKDTRNVIYNCAKDMNIDFIDNYTIFENMDIDKYTADGLHPNEVGHDLIYKNIINSLESN